MRGFGEDHRARKLSAVNIMVADSLLKKGIIRPRVADLVPSHGGEKLTPTRIHLCGLYFLKILEQ